VSQFEVVLDAQPSANVVINVSPSNGEASVAPASLTFTSANWNNPQALTVTGVDDAEADGIQPCTITLSAATSSDAEYSGMSPTPANIPYDVLDNDSAGITVNAASTLSVSETGSTSSFDVFLNSQPSGNVTIGVSSSNTAEATVSVASLTYTTSNWNNPQTVMVTGVDDAVIDGNQTLDIILGAASSTDGSYNGLNPGDVPCINIDDDYNKAILVLAGPSSLVSENGGSSTFQVVLTEAPSANVTIAVSSDDSSEGTVAPVSLTFTTGNWSTAQTVTVSGQDDDIQDGNGIFSVHLTATSSDTDYDGLTPAPLSFENVDDDAAGITVHAGSTMLLSEIGTYSTFEVVLNSEPTDTVTIDVSSSNVNEGTVSTSLLTFTTGNWDISQTVTVTGQDDDLQDGNVSFVVDLTATSTDTTYDGLIPTPLDFETVDDDSAGITIDIEDGLVTSEAGSMDSFYIVLNSEPAADVDIGISSPMPGEVSVNPTAITFTSGNWFLPQPITVTGMDDGSVVDGMTQVSLDLGQASSTDGNYNNMWVDPDGDVKVYNIDDDSHKQVVVLANPEGYFTSENGAWTQIAVVLSEQPADDVTLSGITSMDLSEGTVSPTSLLFTSGNWNIPHFVTVTGVGDGEKGDGKVMYDIDLGVTSSPGDPSADGIAGGTVTVTNIDRMYIDDYVWEPPAPAPFSSISGSGIPIGFREVDFLDGYTAEDEGYEIVPIGFMFYYLGMPYDEIMVFTNGFASFNEYLNNASFWNDALILSSGSAPPEPQADLFVKILSPWWDDLHTGLAGGNVYFETAGSIPFRVFTIEWENAQYTVSSDDTYTFQIKLYEGSNRIEFCYGPVSGGPPDDTTASVGIKDDIGGDNHFIDGLNGAMVESGSSFNYGFNDFLTNSMGGDTFIAFDPTLP
jgi:hypothetical protein